jgi:hypothetical protein
MNPLACQTNPGLSTALALLGLSDVITIPAFLRLEQLFAKMRIAGDGLMISPLSLTWAILPGGIPVSTDESYIEIIYTLELHYSLENLATASPSSEWLVCPGEAGE